MIETLHVPGDNIYGFRVAGKVEKDELLRAIEPLRDMLDEHETVNIYAEVESFRGITLPALIEDFRFGFPNFRKFKKEAIVSDRKWLSIWARIGDALFPGIQVQHFLPSQRAEALAWLRE